MHSVFSGLPGSSTACGPRRYPTAHFSANLGSSASTATNYRSGTGQGPTTTTTNSTRPYYSGQQSHHRGPSSVRTQQASVDNSELKAERAMSQVQSLKKQVTQLHQEANIPRITVSQACEELMRYCLEHEKQDVLVTGISPTENPFKEHKACVLL